MSYIYTHALTDMKKQNRHCTNRKEGRKKGEEGLYDSFVAFSTNIFALTSVSILRTCTVFALIVL